MPKGKKAMLGHKIRRLRRQQDLTQAETAERLGISPSYLNLLENNQRQVTVDLLLRIGQVFDVDLQSFAEDEGARLIGGLAEVFGDPLFAESDVKRQDVADLANAIPSAAQAVIALYKAYRETRDSLQLMADPAADHGEAPPPPGAPGSALDEVRDFFHTQGNYFPALEDAAADIWRHGQLEQGALLQGLADYLDRELTVRVKVMPVEVMGAIRRRYDRHGRRVLLSEMLTPSTRVFQLAVQIGQIQNRALLDRLVAEAGFTSEAAALLGRVGLANYLAGAILMPYEPFYRAATALRYDIEILMQRFEASFEQVCHRLTTLQQPGSKGVPFFMIRVDHAGNISKRYSASRLHFARFGGACPRWNVHDAFAAPQQILRQVSEMPDGERYFSIARTVAKEGGGFRDPGQTFAVALGCEIAYAAQLVYADGIELDSGDIAVPIGLHCRLCERPECSQRAFPPMQHRLVVDENVRGAAAYGFDAG